MIVEGATDKRALFPFLASNVQVIPAGSSSQVIRTYRDLEVPLRDGVLFILDCDGKVDPDLKGNRDLVITKNRDLEADLLIELKALHRVAFELLALDSNDPKELSKKTEETLHVAVEIASNLGIARLAANELSLPTRIVDRKTQKRRKFRFSDLQRPRSRADLLSFDFEKAANEICSLVAWSVNDTKNVLTLASRGKLKRCRRHGSRECVSCKQMSFCNGHDLVDALVVVLNVLHGVTLPVSVFDRMLRVSADRSSVQHWEVFRRIKAWESASKIPVADVGEVS
ncbi:hypothetical protein ACRAKI_06135 [Saccharothrix isguenensis]